MTVFIVILTQKYVGTDYQNEEVSYRFKTGGYYVKIISPTSVDSYFFTGNFK